LLDQLFGGSAFGGSAFGNNFDLGSAFGDDFGQEQWQNQLQQWEPDAPKAETPAAEECGDPEPEAAREMLKEELAKIYGLEDVKKATEDLVDEAVLQELMKQHAPQDMNPPPRRQNFAFLGPPGTGKTTIAQIISKAFCKLGRVKSKAFLQVRPDELIGEYLGQTQKVVKERLEPGLGGVIFIDEAYLIASSGDGHGPNQYQQEALGVVMKLLDEHAEDTVFVFAGYDNDMEDFFKANDGLKRRVPQIFRFAPFSVDDLLNILKLKVDTQAVGLLPDLDEETLDMLTAEFAEFAKSSPKVLPAPGTTDVAKGFVNFVKARTGMMRLNRDRDFQRSHEALQKDMRQHKEGRLSRSFEEGLRAYEERFLDVEIRALLASVPPGMRGKTNGGLIDTVLTAAYRSRASRILKDKLLTSQGCMPNSKTFRDKRLNATKLFEYACPPVLFYSMTDLKVAAKSAVDSWGDDAASDDSTEQAILKALRPVAEQWQKYGKYLVEEASELATNNGHPKVARAVLPVFAEADRAMKIAAGMARNKCGAKPCAEIGFPPPIGEWQNLLQELVMQGLQFQDDKDADIDDDHKKITELIRKPADSNKDEPETDKNEV
jgi:hypothetical protein